MGLEDKVSTLVNPTEGECHSLATYGMFQLPSPERTANDARG